MNPATTNFLPYPLTEVPSPARHDPREPHKVSVERHEDSPALLLIHRSDNGLDNVVRREARRKEPVPPRFGRLHSAEKRCHDVAGTKQGGPDCGGVVQMIELITEGFVQPKQSGLGGTVVTCV